MGKGWGEMDHGTNNKSRNDSVVFGTDKHCDRESFLPMDKIILQRSTPLPIIMTIDWVYTVDTKIKQRTSLPIWTSDVKKMS